MKKCGILHKLDRHVSVKVLQEKYSVGQMTIYDVQYEYHSRNPMVHFEGRPVAKTKQ